MAECSYYRIFRTVAQDRAIRADRRPRVQTVTVPWCAHPTFSPLDQATAKSVIGAGSMLKCGGDLAKCPIADKL